MTAYAGKNLYVGWIHSGGTVVLTGDFRKFDFTPSVDLYDQTAGADEDKTRIVGVKDGQANFSGVMQQDGTAITNALVEGTEGTLVIGPEGTATSKQKITFPAISMGAKLDIPYNNVVDISCNFVKNGAKTDGVF
jgi:hypothetical protein